MNVCRFINSKDIREHLESVKYPFGSLEAIKAEKGVLARRTEQCVLGRSASDMDGGNALVMGRDFDAEDVRLSLEGTSFTLRRGESIFTDNDEQWQWVGHDTDVGGEYQKISIPEGLFAQMRCASRSLPHGSVN